MQKIGEALGLILKALLAPKPHVVLPAPKPDIPTPVVPTSIQPTPQPTIVPSREAANNKFLICPIKATDSAGKTVTARTVKISAVIDHSSTAIDPTSRNRWGKSAKDSRVKAFNGEVGGGEQSAGTPPYGYAKNPATPFFASGEINYVGASSDGVRAKCFLNYDGHAGYDYPYPKLTPVVAAAGGKLYKLLNDEDTTYRQGWPVHHTFVINHGNGYSTSYRHCENLADDIEAKIGTDFNNFALVTEGQLVGYVGSFGTGGSHLHFEVHGAQGRIIDPYSDNLWRDN